MYFPITKNCIDNTMSTSATTTTRAAFGSETAEEAGGRERWNSRVGFYLAAVGSAVGFGNGKSYESTESFCSKSQEYLMVFLMLCFW